MSGRSWKYKIMLTNEERNQLKEVLRSSKTCNNHDMNSDNAARKIDDAMACSSQSKEDAT